MFRVTKILDIKGKKELSWAFSPLVTKKNIQTQDNPSKVNYNQHKTGQLDAHTWINNNGPFQ